MTEAVVQSIKTDIHRYAELPVWLKTICILLFVSGIGLAIFYLFNLRIGSHVMEGTMYYYLLYACFVAPVFLTMPMRRTGRSLKKVPWYDYLMALVLFGCCVYWASQYWEISRSDWSRTPSLMNAVLAGIVMLLSLEGGRRIAGWPLVIIASIMGTYPLYAGFMPGILFGFQIPFERLLAAFAFSGQGMLGLPARVIGEILIGFLVFAGVLIASGGGKFFIDFAMSLMGRYRGGPAKVAVVASGFFGSLSGSPMTNVVSTGSFTIPAMKRTGYPAQYAGAIEAVASTGGMLMPPIMGTVAFVMAEMADVPYTEVLIAAFIPALLFYWGLIVQVDAYAARVGLKGMPRAEIPPMRSSLREGWKFILVLAVLVVLLVYFRRGAQAPFMAAGLLLLLSFTSRKTMLTPKKLIDILAITGNLITFIIAIMMPIGLILIGLQLPGSLTALTAELVSIGGTSNVMVVLLIAAVISYLFGMIGLAIVPYIVLAVLIVPPLVTATGMEPIALHLFLMCYLMIAGITPPVATTAFVAAGMAGSPPMRTAWTASRLAIVIYFVPFFFVFNPSLILRGPPLEIIYSVILAVIGIWLLASGLEGYLLRVGKLEKWARPVLFSGGLLLAYPHWISIVAGFVLSATAIVLSLLRRKPATA